MNRWILGYKIKVWFRMFLVKVFFIFFLLFESTFCNLLNV